MGILGNLLRRAAKKYEKTHFKLYRKLPNNEKCGVCFIGAIALEGAPDRFVADSNLLDGIRDKKTGLQAKYDDILRAVGVPEERIKQYYKVQRRDGTKIENEGLHNFIPNLNDRTDCTFEQAAWILDNRGL